MFRSIPIPSIFEAPSTDKGMAPGFYVHGQEPGAMRSIPYMFGPYPDADTAWRIGMEYMQSMHVVNQ